MPLETCLREPRGGSRVWGSARCTTMSPASWPAWAAGVQPGGPNAGRPRAGEVARKDVPTAGLDERLGDVRERARTMGWDAVVVINSERVVLGLLRSKELEKDPDLRIAQAMRPGPAPF